MTLTLAFLGSAGTVTGSKCPLESDRQHILVDCGAFQGLDQLRLRNWTPFPAEPRSIGAIVLAHAHRDYSGYLPAIVRDVEESKALTADRMPKIIISAGAMAAS